MAQWLDRAAGGTALAGILQTGLRRAALGVTLADGGVLHRDARMAIVGAPGTRLELHLDAVGLHVRARPALEVRGPDFVLGGVRLRFDRGRFEAHLAARHDVLGVIGGIARRFVERALERRVGRYLPPALRHPGYRLADDPHPLATLGAIVDALRGRKPARPGGFDWRAGLVDATLAVIVVAPGDVKLALAADLGLTLAQGTEIALGVDATGPLGDPRLANATLVAEPGVRIGARGHGVSGDLKALVARRADLGPRARLGLQYDLASEAIAGSLLRLLGIATPTGTGPLRLEPVRRLVDKALHDRVSPALATLVRAHDGAVPGWSLARVFGLAGDDAASATA